MAEKQELQLLVRVANTDLDGRKQILYALNKIKGVSLAFGNAALQTAGIDPQAKTGYLSDTQIKKLTEVIENPKKHNFPDWILNRQEDYETGQTSHVINADLDFAKQNDIKRMQMTKSYKGLRHQWRLPLRGQRTKSNFRPSKAKAASTAKRGKKSGPAKK